MSNKEFALRVLVILTGAGQLAAAALLDTHPLLSIAFFVFGAMCVYAGSSVRSGEIAGSQEEAR